LSEACRLQALDAREELRSAIGRRPAQQLVVCPRDVEGPRSPPPPRPPSRSTAPRSRGRAPNHECRMVASRRDARLRRRRAGCASGRAGSFTAVTGKQRAVLSALRDARRAHENAPVSAGQIAAACGGPWHHRSDLVSQALWLLHAQGLVTPSACAARAWKLTAAGRAALPPRRGPARSRPLIAGAHRPARPR
jgi:hypothetical protein